jgi:purine-nucleoside phosphorylase
MARPAGPPGQAGEPGRARVPGDPFTAARDSAACLARRTGIGQHDVAVILGSGWAPAAAALGAARTEVPLAELGGFPAPTVAGHAGLVRSVRAGPGGSVRVLVFLGRTHLYEGHPVPVVVHGVRTAIAAGCRTVVLTNAAGGLRQEYQVGQPVLIRDHLNLTGRSPLAGPPPPPGYPPRFADMTEAYSPRLRALAREADPGLAEGVYAALPGPQYETPAEIGMLRALGADLVGMSTVLEVIAARHLGAEVLAISVVTNPAAGLAGHQLSHDEVVAAGSAAAARMGTLLAGILPRIR